MDEAAIIRVTIRWCVLAVLPVFFAVSSMAQKPRVATVVVTVFADSGIVTLAGAEVSVADVDRSGRSDSPGVVTLREIPFGTHSIRERMLGYAPLEAQLRLHTDTMTAEFRLMPTSVKLDTIRVLKSRIANGLEEFEQLIASTRGSCGADPSRVGTNGRGRPSGGGSCLAGVPCVVPTLMDGEDVRGADALVKPADLAGVEYYTGSQIPAQYRVSGSGCGLLILWLRK